MSKYNQYYNCSLMFGIVGFCFYFHLRQVDTGFGFVAGVVADVEHIVVPKKSGITCVTAAGQFYEFGHSAVGDVDIRQGRMRSALVHSAGGNPVSAGNADEVGAAETLEIRPEVFPLPLLVVGPAYSQECTG